MTETALRRVTTQTAVYDFDLVNDEVRRRPKDEASSEDWEVRENRRDGEWMHLVSFADMEVGKRMMLFVIIPETPKGFVTTRVTTPVQKVEILG